MFEGFPKRLFGFWAIVFLFILPTYLRFGQNSTCITSPSVSKQMFIIYNAVSIVFNYTISGIWWFIYSFNTYYLLKPGIVERDVITV